jgi:uncharacterized protein (DUF608 family)
LLKKGVVKKEYKDSSLNVKSTASSQFKAFSSHKVSLFIKDSIHKNSVGRIKKKIKKLVTVVNPLHR